MVLVLEGWNSAQFLRRCASACHPGASDVNEPGRVAKLAPTEPSCLNKPQFPIRIQGAALICVRIISGMERILDTSDENICRVLHSMSCSLTHGQIEKTISLSPPRLLGGGGKV